MPEPLTSPRVIVFNGGSSSGKSTLTRALQDVLPGAGGGQLRQRSDGAAALAAGTRGRPDRVRDHWSGVDASQATGELERS